MNEEQIRASDAQTLLNSPIFKAAVKQMDDYLESQALSTDPDNKDKCSRIVISKQLLKGIVRELNRFVEDGQIAELVELEKQRKTIRERVFQR